MPQLDGLARQRLLDLLPRLWDSKLALVVAPAGSGKTTFLAQVAAVADAPVAWYSADSSDGDAHVLFSRLERAFREALPDLEPGWTNAADAASAVDELESRGARCLLVLDDFHALTGTAAEAEVERLLHYAPRELAIVIASRLRPNFNLPRLLVSDALVEIGPDELRFRSWEVERLFRDVYREPLPPEDLAQLTRRTEGWAAALQLFHLATRGKSTPERRRTIAALAGRSKLVRDYLAMNVLDELPPDLRRFLIHTSVFSRLTGALCDELLDRRDSVEILDELERRQIFTQTLDDEGHYRYHEVLRSHLETALVGEVGEAAARLAYRRAGALLERADMLADALRAYYRGEDWEAVGRLLGQNGSRLADGRPAWIELLPPSLARNDPWLVLARARQERAAGRLERAIAAYHEAERAFGPAAASEICRAERVTLAAWVEPVVPRGRDWTAVLRTATMRDPLAVRRSAGGEPAEMRLAAGLGALLAGYLDDAVALLRQAELELESNEPLVLAARLASAVTLLLRGDAEAAARAELVAEDAERCGIPWFARIALAALALAGGDDGQADAEAARAASESAGDAWGSALASFTVGWGALRSGTNATPRLEEAVDGFRRLGAGSLEAWARGALAIAAARRGDPEARQSAVQADVFARSTGVRAAQACAYLALAELDDRPESEYRRLALAVRDETSLALPAPPSGAADAGGVAVAIRCFARFSFTLDDRPLDLHDVKPRARQLLRLLALHAGQWVHREVLGEALWPATDPETAMRNLHVAISSLRGALERNAGPEGRSLIDREGDAYALVLPRDARVDVVDFATALSAGRAARAAGDDEGAESAFSHALALYEGDLLPEDGPAEWVVNERERRRAEACEAASALATIYLARGDAAAVAAACERGLYLDPHRDELWRALVDAFERAGDTAAATRSRRRYAQVLADLGVPSDTALAPAATTSS